METDNGGKDKEVDEVADEIEAALKDPRGLVYHQKRLGFCLSEGITDLLERYLRNQGILKEGFKIDHRVLKKKRENVKELLENKITSPIENLDKIEKILNVAYKIELSRNKLVYGKSVSEELLENLIDLFLNLKKEVNNE